MRQSEFQYAVTQEFGAYGAVLLRDLVIGSLGGRTAEQALAAGARPRDVWLALCAAEDVPESRRHGAGLPKPKD
jgi:hypothetical protein